MWSRFIKLVQFVARKWVNWHFRYNPVFRIGSYLVKLVLVDTGYWASLKSKGRIRLPSFLWFTDESKKLKWDDKGVDRRIGLISYPRSGNSLLRHLLETSSGVYTGCDTHPERSLSKQLRECGMLGEGVVDESVWFVKSHYPERVGWKPFRVRKVILIVRNPWDAMDSYFNMMLTNTHNVSLHDSMYVRFEKRWNDFVHSEIHVWKKFHEYWTRKKLPVPLMIVRYEDLLCYRTETMRRIYKFVLEKESLKGTEFEQVVNTIGKDQHGGPYKPRKGKIANSFNRYSKAQFEYVRSTANALLKGFGYDPEHCGFPDDIQLPVRCTRMPVNYDENTWLHLNEANNPVRDPMDTFGRLSSRFRKALVEPVLSSDGTKLNMEEVMNARNYAAAKDKHLKS